MFGLFSSVEKRTRESARQWIETAEKVYDYRRDELNESDRAALIQSTEKLRALVKDKADASRMKLGTEALESVLRQTGGKFYPRSGLQEYVEFFVVAAIVLLGLRAYFFQPFKIPTNSMWPTYNGMTPYVYPRGAEEPGLVTNMFRAAAFGASHRSVVAPASGRLYLKLAQEGHGFRYFTKAATVRRFFILPSRGVAYTFSVDGGPEVDLVVPEEFDIKWLLRDGFPSLSSATLRKGPPERGNVAYLDLGITVEKGKPFLSFDLMTGDNLVVDRLSYHFVRPSVGSAFVFHTRKIEGLGGDFYYIKRLVGAPGDVLEIRDPVLWRNGAPIDGADAFESNNKRLGKYTGYVSEPHAEALYLRKGEKLTIPAKSYFAMGDNSSNSKDSRYWGFVPYKEVVGRPLFIYYPFHDHWGLAK